MLNKLPDLLEVDVYEFEELVQEFVKSMGFEIMSSVRTPDGILDILAKTVNPMGGKIISLVRAAPFERNVDHEEVKDLHDTMLDKGAVRAAFITTSDFTQMAREYARGKPVSLINKFKLIESLEEQGIKIRPKMYEFLERHGLTEHRFRKERYVFVSGKNMKEVMEYFNGRVKKKSLGIFGRAEKILNITLRHSPVSIFKVIYADRASTEARSIAKIELEDDIHVDLNTVDLYYIKSGRGVGRVKRTLESTDVLRNIEDLPPDAKQHLIDLLNHGELPYKHLDDKYLSILESKKIINVIDATKTPIGGFVARVSNLVLMGAQEIANIISLVIHELLTTTPAETKKREGESPESKEDEEDKTVRAEVSMPHTHGGVYDLKKFILVEKDTETRFEEDLVKYSSGPLADLLGTILQASVKPQGVLFMPYYVCTFVDEETGTLTRRERLITPKFLEEEQKAKKRKERQSKKEVGTPYKIIR